MGRRYCRSTRLQQARNRVTVCTPAGAATVPGVGSKRLPRFCAYCGTATDLTRDHIPPQSLFPDDPAHRVDLITVPACRRCNRKFEADDQYFALAISAHLLTGQNPVAASLHERAKRGLAYVMRKPLGRKIAKELGRVELQTPTGLFAGYQPIWKYDRRVIDRVACRIVRGLYFHHFGSRVPPGARVGCQALRDIPMRTAADHAGFEPLFTLLQTQPLRDIGPGVFKYRFGAALDNPAFSAWIMTIYDAVEFAGFIEPEAEAT